jgi:hypothetical protein
MARGLTELQSVYFLRFAHAAQHMSTERFQATVVADRFGEIR